METIAETPLEQGEVRGLGRGRLEGLAEGKAKTFLRQAWIRFGDVHAARAVEVRTAEAVTLDRWLAALVVAETLEEVFKSRRRH